MSVDNSPNRPPNDRPKDTESTRLTWSQILEEEDQALLTPEQRHAPSSFDGVAAEDETARLKTIIKLLHSRRRSALCLSGGGVRSATFALGVLQGLANVRVLDRFDYLSTVSGGGYIGGWLTAWLHREGKTSVLAGLDPEQASTATSSTPSPVERVRETCRFLAPQGGLLSADVWTLLVTMGRNLILNWFVLLPLIAAALLVPHLYYAIVKALEITSPPPPGTPCLDTHHPAIWLLAITVGAFAIQTGYIAINSAGKGAKWSQHLFLSFVLLPSIVGSVAFTLFWSAYPCELNLGKFLFLGSVIPATGWLVVGVLARPGVLTALPAVTAMAASLYAWSQLPADVSGVGLTLPEIFVQVLTAILLVVLLIVLGMISRRLNRSQEPPPGAFQVLASGRTVFAALASGPMLGGGLWLLYVLYFPFSTPFTEGYAVFAVPAILGIWALATVMFIGLAGVSFSDAALEWWNRCGAWVCIAAVAWLAAFVFDFYLADAVQRAVHWLTGGIEPVVAVFVLLLSSVAGLAARSGPAADRPSLLRRTLQVVGLPLVTLVLLSSIAWADARALGVYVEQGGSYKELHEIPVARVLWLGGALLCVGLFMSRSVPVNRFSLHGMYRQRLMRTFLGASNSAREPNAFTGFDSRDDIHIHELADVRPLHVVNATLNVLSATEVGHNDRRAQPFTFSPLHVGSRQTAFGYRRAARYRSDDAKGEPGLSLGLALAVSGAAASPAMGVYSSKAGALLLTLANARLGLWFGNPGNDSTWCMTEPPLGIGPLMREILGLTTEHNPYVYLSDGGHFENLGLYEMVARRCHCIVVSDAGCDPDYTYNELGDAIRRIRLDFGVPIEFVKPLSATRVGQSKGNPHGAVAVIKYSFADGPDAPDGMLVYMKATLSGIEPVDVWNFAKTNPTFPHDPTSDQFFDEARFESYRSLGFQTVKTLVGKDFKGDGGVEGLGEAISRSLADPQAASASQIEIAEE